MSIALRSTLIIALMLAFTVPFFAGAQGTSCSFTRDLEAGVADGEDIRCLQQYLNASGFPVAASGVGSKGQETPQYKEKTIAAVKAWQAKNGLPASGYFGPQSRAKYAALTKATPATPAVPGVTPATPATPGNQTALQAQLQALLAQVDKLKNQQQNTVPVASNKSAQEIIRKAINAIEDAEDQMDDYGGDKTAAEDNLKDARTDLFDAVDAYFDGNYEKAVQYADDAYDNAVDAYEDAGGVSKDDEADDLIDEVEDKIDEAQDTIEEADDDGKDVDDAEDLLEEATQKLEEAKEAYDDDQFEEAKELAEDADDLVGDALDAIGSSKQDTAKDAIKKAQSAISDARDEIEEADDDGKDVDDAEDVLADAEDLLDEAEEAYDDEDYEDAIDLAKDARSTANDALDEL